MTLHTLSLAISGLEGDVDDQCSHVQRLHANLPPLDAYLKNLALLDQQCEEANIDENDFTTYTYDELAYELGLVKSSVAKKLSFLENQMVARNMTNLTPIQLEEFESVFRHFDRDLTNSLQELEFSAALASLSLVYDEHEMHENFVAISAGRGYVTFEQFIRFMVSVTEDQNTAEQVFQSFAEVADGKVRETTRLSSTFNLHPLKCYSFSPLPFNFFTFSSVSSQDYEPEYPSFVFYKKKGTLTHFFIINSPTSPKSTSATPSSPITSSKTFYHPCPNTKAPICKKTAIGPNTITSASWNR